MSNDIGLCQPGFGLRPQQVVGIGKNDDFFTANLPRQKLVRYNGMTLITGSS